MRAADVHAVEVRDAAVALRHVDVLQLAIHIVFRFYQLAAVGLPRGYFDCDLVALEQRG